MRALANLLSNSYKYTETGGASITLGLETGQAIIKICDSGSGMPPGVVTALNDGTATRIRADETTPGTGSGFGSARRIIETLRGSLEILSSTTSGTEIRITLPAAFPSITPVSADDLRATLEGWTLLDFDDRARFEQGLMADGAAKERIIALTYDDSTVTRGRLSEIVAMVVIKPPCSELLLHPLLGGASKQV